MSFRISSDAIRNYREQRAIALSEDSSINDKAKAVVLMRHLVQDVAKQARAISPEHTWKLKVLMLQLQMQLIHFVYIMGMNHEVYKAKLNSYFNRIALSRPTIPTDVDMTVEEWFKHNDGAEVNSLTITWHSGHDGGIGPRAVKYFSKRAMVGDTVIYYPGLDVKLSNEDCIVMTHGHKDHQTIYVYWIAKD